MKDQERCEAFTGTTAAMRADNRWLGAEDIYGYGDVHVKITAVIRYTNVKFEDGRVKKELFALRFDGKKKELILSPTKRRPIVKAWGTNVQNWIGKTITLYVDTDVRKPGTRDEKTWGVRVREIDVTAPPKQAGPAKRPEPAPPDDELAQWLSGVAVLTSAQSCAEFRDLLNTCPPRLHGQVSAALKAKEAELGQT